MAVEVRPGWTCATVPARDLRVKDVMAWRGQEQTILRYLDLRPLLGTPGMVGLTFEDGSWCDLPPETQVTRWRKDPQP